MYAEREEAEREARTQLEQEKLKGEYKIANKKIKQDKSKEITPNMTHLIIHQTCQFSKMKQIIWTSYVCPIYNTSWSDWCCSGKSVTFFGILDCGGRPAVDAFMFQCLKFRSTYIDSVNNSVSLHFIIMA